MWRTTRSGCSTMPKGNWVQYGSSYDMENRMVQGPTWIAWHYAYDPNGKRVYIDDGSTKRFSFYSIGGQKLITVSCSYNQACDYPKTSVYFGGKVMRNGGNSASGMGWTVM